LSLIKRGCQPKKDELKARALSARAG